LSPEYAAALSRGPTYPHTGQCVLRTLDGHRSILTCPMPGGPLVSGSDTGLFGARAPHSRSKRPDQECTTGACRNQHPRYAAAMDSKPTSRFRWLILAALAVLLVGQFASRSGNHGLAGALSLFASLLF